MYPNIAATNTSTEETETTSHTIDLPSGITSGDLLLVFVRYAFDETSNISPSSTPSGWTKIISTADNGRLDVYRKIADGGEGSTITVTTNAVRRSAHASLRITGVNTTTPLYFATNTSSVPGSYNNPPALSTGQAEMTPFLWLAFASSYRTLSSVTAPADYTNLLNSTNTYTSGDEDEFCCLAIATRDLRAATEDPSAFGGVPTRSHYAITIAINPASQSETGGNTFITTEPEFFINATTLGATGTNALLEVSGTTLANEGSSFQSTTWTPTTNS